MKAETSEQAATKAAKKFLSRHARKIMVAVAPSSRWGFDVTAEVFGETKTLRLYAVVHSDEPAEANDLYL